MVVGEPPDVESTERRIDYLRCAASTGQPPYTDVNESPGKTRLKGRERVLEHVTEGVTRSTSGVLSFAENVRFLLLPYFAMDLLCASRPC